MKSQNRIDNMVKDALAIELESAIEANALGFMARALVQATLPHRNPGKDVQAWGRENGAYSLVIQPGYFKKNNTYESMGLPYGTIPRLLLAWITTEAVKTKEKKLILGQSLSEFMRKLNLVPTGGRWGSITRLKEQTKKLFAAKITCTYDNDQSIGIQNVNIVDEAMLWWEPKNPHQSILWESVIELSDKFFNEIQAHPVPIDMRALNILKQSPMALDIYNWLTYRMSYLKKHTSIPWGFLQNQFGCDYQNNRQGRYGFKRNFNNQLKSVLLVYPEAKIETTSSGILLKPSKPHISFKQPEKPFLIPNQEQSIYKTQQEEQKQKVILNKYENYKLNKLIQIINSDTNKKIKTDIVIGFNKFLTRRNLNTLRSQIKNIEESDKSFRIELYNYINNYWHHLLKEIKSFKDFYTTIDSL